MPRPQVSIRLATDGKAQVERDFADIATSGDNAAQRYQSSWERASAAARAAIEREAKAAERLAALSASPVQQQINRATGVGADPSGTAKASAQALAQQLDAAEKEARQLIAAIDPLFAAEARYAAQVERINAVKATGQISEQRYQQLLANEKLLLDQSTAAGLRNTGMRGQMRMGAQQLGFQMNDVASQLAMGTRASVIFAQQSAQVVQALQLMGGEGNAFLRFLGGPWGIALSVAVVALTPFIGKLFETGETVDSVVEKLKKEHRQQNLNDEAHRVFATTLDGVTEALHKNRDALKGLEDQGKTAADAALANARAQLMLAEVNKFAADSELRYAKAILERKRAAIIGPETKGHVDPAQAEFNRLATEEQGRLDALGDTSSWNAAIAEAKRQIAEAESHIAVEAGMRDAAERIKRLYEGRDGLIEKTRERLLNEKATSAEIERQVRLLHDRESAEIKAAQERDKKPAKNAGGTAIFGDQIASFFDIANRYRGMSETANKGVLEQFFREANEELDPEKVKWCAAFVNAVLAAGGVSGSGSLAARSFLNYGKDDTSSPQKGDIVILKGAAGDHVGFLDSIDAKGNVRVLAGNTGNKVAEATYGASSVMGIRRPPTPAEQYAADAKDDETRLKRLQDLMAAEQEVTVAKEDQVNFIEQYNREQDRSIQGVLAMVADFTEWNRQVERMNASMDEFRQFGDDILDTLFNPDNWNNWGDLGKKVLHDLELELIKLSLLNPLKNALLGENNPTASSLFTTLGGLFGRGAIPGADLSSLASVDLPSAAALGSLPGGFGSGTEYAPGGLAWVGEFGKELVRLPRGSKVTPAAESRRIAAANDGGIGTINMPINIDATGADAAGLARVEAKVDQLRAEIPGTIVATYLDAVDRNVIRK